MEYYLTIIPCDLPMPASIEKIVNEVAKIEDVLGRQCYVMMGDAMWFPIDDYTDDFMIEEYYDWVEDPKIQKQIFELMVSNDESDKS